MTNTINDSNNRDDSSRSHALPDTETTQSANEETWRADAGWECADLVTAELRRLIERHEEEVNGGTPISGEEWEIASYALPRVDYEA